MDVFTEVKHKRKMGIVFPFKRKRGLVVKKQPFGRILSSVDRNGRTVLFHATNGKRTERITP